MDRYKPPGAVLFVEDKSAIHNLTSARRRLEAGHQDGGISVQAHHRAIKIEGRQPLNGLRWIVRHKTLFREHVAGRRGDDAARVHDRVQSGTVTLTDVLQPSTGGLEHLVMGSRLNLSESAREHQETCHNCHADSQT